MSSVDKALATQLANIEKKTGKTLADFAKILQATGLSKHGELRDFLKREHGLGHGDANTLVHIVNQSHGSAQAAAVEAGGGDLLDEIYSGAKAGLRPIHDKVMAAITKFGEFEIAPKKGYVSLRRKKQFATLGPPTNSRVEVGLNIKGVPATDRLEELPPKSMCQYRVKLTDAKQVDAELIGWIRQAYDAAG